VTSAAPVLRAYQRRDVDRIREHYANDVAAVCYQLPTGGGKTVVFVHILVAAAAKGSRVLVLAHRDEILLQIIKALSESGIGFGIIAAGYPASPNERVQVASVYSIPNRIDRIGKFDLVIIDEAHHAVASTWRDTLAALSGARVLGVSATPERLDGKGLDDIFDELVRGPTVRELIDGGYLAPFVAYGPKTDLNLGSVRVTAGDYQIDQLADVMSDGIVVKSAVSEYRRLCPGAPAIAFCVDIAHSQQVAKAFRDGGWRAAHVDGNTQRDERRDLIASLADGRLDVLTNCGLISEGLDVPGVVAAILLRPTMSRALYLQQVGRALRPGKPKAFILDHAGCIQRHGLPDHPHEWTLEGRPKKGASAGSQQPPTRQCEHCGAFNSPTATHCQECGTAIFVPTARDDIKVELTEIAPVNEPWFATAPFDEVIRWAGRDCARLREIARARGYKPGWVYYRMLEPQDQQTSG
jgi:DNA repair protein RadD